MKTCLLIIDEKLTASGISPLVFERYPLKKNFSFNIISSQAGIFSRDGPCPVANDSYLLLRFPSLIHNCLNSLSLPVLSSLRGGSLIFCCDEKNFYTLKLLLCPGKQSYKQPFFSSLSLYRLFNLVHN